MSVGLNWAWKLLESKWFQKDAAPAEILKCNFYLLVQTFLESGTLKKRLMECKQREMGKEKILVIEILLGLKMKWA